MCLPRKFLLWENYLELLLESRGEDCLSTNILLLLLVVSECGICTVLPLMLKTVQTVNAVGVSFHALQASLQFAIPLHLMQETLDATRLRTIGLVLGVGNIFVYIMQIGTLPI